MRAFFALLLIAAAGCAAAEHASLFEGHHENAPILDNRRMLTLGLFHPWFHPKV